MIRRYKPETSMLRNSRIDLATIIVIACALTACSKKEEASAPVAAAAPAPAAETQAAPTNGSVKTFSIGQLSAMALRDGGIELPNDNKVFGIGHTPEEVAALLTAAGQPTDKLQLSIQPLLVKATDRVLLFDTGAGTNFGPGAGQLATSLGAAGVDPQSVTDIFISHVHGDHVGGLVNAQGALAFPNATIHISKPEWAYLSGMNADTAKSVGLSDHVALVNAMKPKVAAFAPGAELVPGTVKALEITGHTPGHSGYTITSGDNSLVYVGDSMHHYIVSVQKPDWACGFDGDAKSSAESRGALLSRLAASGQRVYAVHFPFPGVGKIEKRGEELVWVAQ
jgi:glyoxylase-like metal-dependent hydrolase (beta-lactamase superfamily II)